MMPPFYRIEGVRPEPIADPFSTIGATIQTRPYWRVVRICDSGQGQRKIVASKSKWADALNVVREHQAEDAKRNYVVALVHGLWYRRQRQLWIGRDLAEMVDRMMAERRERAKQYAPRRVAA